MARTRTLTEATTYKLLSDTRRLHLLSLLNENGTMDVDDLASRIAARERAGTDEDTRRRITISLVHKHLPLLEDHNVVQYDAENGTVVLLDVFDELEQYLDEEATQESVLQKLLPGN